MRFRIDYEYEADGMTRQGSYITDDPQEFLRPMRQTYGDKVTSHIQEAKQ